MMTLSLDMSTSLLTKHTQEHYFPIITPLSTSSYSPSAFNLHRGTIQPESLSQRCIRDSGIVAMANIRDFQEPFTPQPDQLTSDPKLLNPWRSPCHQHQSRFCSRLEPTYLPACLPQPPSI